MAVEFSGLNFLVKEQAFYLDNLQEFLKNALLREGKTKEEVVLMTCGEECIDLYAVGEIDSMGLLARKDLPVKMSLHKGIAEKQIENLFGTDVKFVSLMINQGVYRIQFNIFKKDVGSKTKVTCVYESVDELAYALQFLKDNTK